MVLPQPEPPVRRTNSPSATERFTPRRLPLEIFSSTPPALPLSIPSLTEIEEDQETSVYDFTGRRLLVVDDNMLNIKVLKKAIKALNFEVDECYNGAEALEKIAPVNKDYHHDATWHDGNGYAHVRAAIVGNSTYVPLIDGALQLGQWQQIVLVDFDNKPRNRTVYVQIVY